MRTLHVVKAVATVETPVEDAALFVDVAYDSKKWGSLEELQAFYREESERVMQVFASMPQGLRYQILLRMLEAAPLLRSCLAARYGD